MRRTNEINVTVHPFYRPDGDNRTRHRTTLEKCLDEVAESLQWISLEQDRAFILRLINAFDSGRA
jgi:hypothetical protein